MAQIYTIQASDAPQHTGKLQDILHNLKTDNRIGSFTTVKKDEGLSSITDTIQEEDLILVVLTHQLDSQREQIETELKALQAARPGVRIGEIIVDNVPYENEFITFPADLRNIRDREDLDAVWGGIEQSLKDMFPIQEKEEAIPSDWPKYLKIAGIVIGLIFVFFIGQGLFGESNDTVRKVDARVVEEVKNRLADARTALRTRSIEAEIRRHPDIRRQLSAVLEAIESEQIESIIAAGPERALVREIETLKSVATAMAEQVQDSEDRMNEFRRRILLAQNGLAEVNQEQVRQWREVLEEEKAKIEATKQSISSVREAAVALERARQVIVT